MDARQDNLFFYNLIKDSCLLEAEIFRLLWEGWARARARAKARAKARARARAGLGLGIHKFTEGYLYFRKYRYAGYAILRDTNISVTPVKHLDLAFHYSSIILPLHCKTSFAAPSSKS